MTTAQIVAIILVVIALSDVIIGYGWLFPKIKNSKPSQDSLVELLASEDPTKKHRTLKILKAALDIWAVIALVIAYFLWNNPDII